MKYRIIMAGFGGQGVLFLGKAIALAAVHDGYEASWLPSYGPEMRGGTANCRVVISDKAISSPAVTSADTVIAMNKPSLDKFEASCEGCIITDGAFAPDGAVGIDSSLCRAGGRFDGLVNMVMLGAFLEKSGVISREAAEAAIKEMSGARAEHNLAAVEYGRSFVSNIAK